MTFRHSPIVSTALVLTFGAAFAACSGAQRADTVSATASSRRAPDSTGGTTVSCKQLTKDMVQPLMEQPITTIQVTAAGTNAEGQQCIFGEDDGDNAVDVMVLGGEEGAQEFALTVKEEAKDQVAVPGVGDKAVRKAGENGVDAIKGNVYCSVSGQVPGIGKLERAAGGTTHIAESAYAAEAAALGTLCNRIFGSGNTTPDLSAITAAASRAH